MKIFDSHCHLDDQSFKKDFDQVMKRAHEAGVIRMMAIGINQRTSILSVALAQAHEDIYASVGVHPHDVKNCSESMLREMMTLTSDRKNVLAWGEIGLDYNRMYSPRQVQEKWFDRQLAIAAELELPMIFHERDSNGRFLDILKNHRNNTVKGVVHCFSGNQYELNEYLALGLHIGITGILTINGRGAQLRKMAAGIPSDRLLVETDAPYLVPAPQKNHARRNEPAYVKSVLLKLAEVRNEEPEELAEIIWKNTCQLYRVAANTCSG
jgi:TatD DNase family protein